METALPFDSADLRRLIPAARLRTAGLIHVTLLMGTTVFLSLVVWFHIQNAPAESGAVDPADLELYLQIAAATGAAALGCWMTAALVGGLLAKPAQARRRLQGAETPEEAVSRLMELVMVGIILRGALLEAAALACFTAMLVAAMGGGLYAEPWLWLLGFPYLVQLGYTLMNLPTRESVADWLQQKIVGPLQRGKE